MYIHTYIHIYIIPLCCYSISFSQITQEICSQPKLFTGGASRFDVQQGILGDCWLVAAIASLTQDKILFNKVSTKNNTVARVLAGSQYLVMYSLGERGWV